jgi:chromate transporter
MEASHGLVAEPQGTKRSNLGEVAVLFLRLGITAFGGPAAHVAIMEDEIVRRRHWITQERFLDLLGAVNLIPGPNSTEMAIYLGYLRAGWMGLILGGICFILPAMLIVMGMAWAYVRYGGLPQFAALLYGVSGAISATVGIFLPSFLLIAVSGPLIPRLRRSPLAGAFLDGVNVASLALMAVVTWQLGRTAIFDVATVALAILGATLLIGFRINSAWLALGGAAVGMILQTAHVGG